MVRVILGFILLFQFATACYAAAPNSSVIKLKRFKSLSSMHSRVPQGGGLQCFVDSSDNPQAAKVLSAPNKLSRSSFIVAISEQNERPLNRVLRGLESQTTRMASSGVRAANLLRLRDKQQLRRLVNILEAQKELCISLLSPTPSPTPEPDDDNSDVASPPDESGNEPDPTATPSAPPAATPAVPTATPTITLPSATLNGTPLNLQLAYIASSGVLVSWNDGATNNAATRIERAVNSGPFVELEVVSDADTIQFQDSTVQYCTLYRYRLAYYYSGGGPFGAYSNIAQISIPSASGLACPQSTAVATPTGTPLPTVPPNQPPHLATDNNTLYLKNQSASVVNNYPLTFARPFKIGEIQNFPEVLIDGVPVLTQADVKVRWPDGSVRHAILSLIVPSMAADANLLLSFQNQTSGNNAGRLTEAQMLGGSFDFDAVLQIANSSAGFATASARTMLSAGACSDYANGPLNICRLWLQGPVATSIILSDHSLARLFDIGFDVHRSLRPIFLATFYPAVNKVFVRFIGEVANTEVLQDLNYDLTLLVGSNSPQPVYSKPGHNHPANARWTKSFWLGGDPGPIAINHNLQYIASTGMSLNYDTSLTVASSVIATDYADWLSRGREIGDTGQLARRMGNAGARPDLGPTTSWATSWLYTGDSRAREIAFGNSDLAASFPIHYREGQAGRHFDRADTVPALGYPISISARPSILLLYPTTSSGGFNFPGDVLSYVGPVTYNLSSIAGVLNLNAWIPKRSHLPDYWYFQYLLTGDFWYLEEGQFWATWAEAQTQPFNGQHGRNGEDGLNPNDFNIRGQAWTLRTLALASAASVDGSPEKALIGSWVKNSLSAWQAERGLATTAGGAPSAISHGVSPGAGNTYVNFNGSNGAPLGYVNLGPSPLHFWAYENQSYVSDGGAAIDPTQAHGAIAMWMQCYMMIVQRWVQTLGFNNDNLVDWLAQNYIEQINDPSFNPNLIDQYRTPVVGANNLPFASWADVKSAFLPSVQNTLIMNTGHASGQSFAPDNYPPVINGAIGSAAGGAINQSDATQMYNTWISMYGAYYSSTNPIPKWAVLP